MTTTTRVDDRAAAPLAPTFERFFATKTACDVEGTMAYFSRDLVTYTDATLGWDCAGYDALRAVFVEYMPAWGPPARSYTTGVHSNEVSALVHMVDTPELFGGELRILAAVDLRDGKVVRWVDYWDGATFDAGLYRAMRTPDAQFPKDLRDDQVPTQAAPELVAAASTLHAAFAAGDAEAAAARLHTDVVLTDMTLRTNVAGRLATTRYLERVLGEVPYGRGSVLRHVVGGATGGGFEWTAGSTSDGLVGITALELDADGLVTSLTSVYDGRRLPAERRASLAAAALPS